jgi:glutamine synthetase
MGHMLCDLLDQKWEREVSSSRQVALQQIDSLQTLGLNIVTSYDLEFTIFHKDTLTPVGLHEDTSKLVLSLSTSLPEGGLPVVSVGRGMDPGQLVISLGSQAGIAAADGLHQLHCALKSLCAKEGYDITLMTRPLDGVSGNRSSYNIALKTNDGRNVFHDLNSEEKISALARHWVAGRLLHRAAVTALARPTLNCYSLTNDQDRLQIRASGSSVYVTDLLPSSSSNPYLVTGALIAAGLDGIRNKLEPTEKISANVQLQSKTPATFSDALLSLEEATVFKDLIGAKLVHRFLLLKREFEVGRLDSLKAQNDNKNILGFEQSLYLLSP